MLQTDRTGQTGQTDMTDRQTGRQRSDSTGRTVLQTVAQKSTQQPNNNTIYANIIDVQNAGNTSGFC